MSFVTFAHQFYLISLYYYTNRQIALYNLVPFLYNPDYFYLFFLVIWCNIEVDYLTPSKTVQEDPMKYKMTELTEELSIKRIISIHYFEYMSDFVFAGESHNFWELLCVDKGELEITANHEKLILKKSELIFHKPNEFHALKANGIIAPNLVVVAFDCGDPCMQFFEDKILTVGDDENSLLAQIMAEARDGFSSPLDDPYLEQLVRREKSPFACEQMIKILLEQLLIQLYRKFTHVTESRSNTYSFFDTNQLYDMILAYFESNICNQLSLDKICKDNLISISQLKRVFREKSHTSTMEYFTKLKVSHAKQLIRNRQMNFTQIADYLGYTSVHYFSRQFKKETGMTPSEYMVSIKQLAERY